MPNTLFVWTVWGVPGALAGIFAIGAAVLIWNTTHNVSIRRRVTLLLVVEATMMLTGIGGPMQWFVEERHVHFIFLLHVLNDCFLIAVYLPAIAVAVDSPLLKTFRKGYGLVLMPFLGLVLFIAILVLPAGWQHSTIPLLPGYGSSYTNAIGPLNGIIFLILAITYVYGLIATVMAWRNSKSEVRRKQTGSLAIAFAIRDLSWGVLYLAGAVLVYIGFDQTDRELMSLTMTALPAPYIAHLLYVSVMVYAIAMYNILDIDLRLKRTLKGSTVTAIFVSSFFIVSEASATILSEQVGTIMALVATGLLLFFLAPLQNLADRLANKAMPTVQDTPEYKTFRSIQVYGAAIEDAVRHGGIEGVQRIALDKLRVDLGLDAEEASELELKLVG